MESIAAFSLACNVIQIINAGNDAAQTIYQIYKNGSAIDHTHLELLTKQLSSLNLDLQIKDPELQQVAKGCKNISQALLSELSQLKAVSKKEILTKFVRGLRKKDTIGKLKDRLADHERLLNTGLLLRIRSQYDAMQLVNASQFQTLDSTTKLFVSNLAGGVTQVENVLRTEGQSTRQAVHREHTETRALIATTQLQNITEQQKQQLLRSLHFQSMNARRNQISSHYPGTFEWVFGNDNELNGKYCATFLDWLHSEEQLYFVEGKAASGKSTLMKFLATDDRTQRHLQDHNPSTKIISHHFWLAGELVQRNLHGCLLSLVHQIILTDTNVAASLGMNNKYHPADWSELELTKLFLGFLAADSYCIFLDGLDEFEETESEALLDLITRLKNQHNVKLCLSSRPSTLYQKQLQPRFGIRLQDLNHRDIETYVSGRLNKAQNDGQLARDVELGGVVSSISHQAQGVFLWAHLASSSVLRGLRNYASKQELFARVEQLPPDINRLYEDMLRRQEGDRPLLQAEMALYFRLATSIDALSGGYHSGRTLCYVYAVVSGRLNGISESDFKEDVLSKEIDRVIHRVEYLCAGFLELNTKVGRGSDVNSDGKSSEEKEEEEEIRMVHANEGEETGFVDDAKGEKDSTTSDARRQLVEAATRHFVFTHRTAHDFILQQPMGQSILESCEVAHDQLWRLIVESAVVFWRCGGDVSLDTIVERALDIWECWVSSKQIQPSAQTMTSTMIYLTNSFFGGPTYIRRSWAQNRHDIDGPREQSESHLSGYWLGYSGKVMDVAMLRCHLDSLAIDLLGITLEMGVPNYFEYCLQPHLIRLRDRGLLRQEYVDYLLFCACRGLVKREQYGTTRVLVRDAFCNGLRRIINILVDVGASFERELCLESSYCLRQSALSISLWGCEAVLGDSVMHADSQSNQCFVQGLITFDSPHSTRKLLYDEFAIAIIMEVRLSGSRERYLEQAMNRITLTRTSISWQRYERHIVLVQPGGSSDVWNVDQEASSQLLELWEAWERYIDGCSQLDSTASAWQAHESSVATKIDELCSDKSTGIDIREWLKENGYLKDISDPEVTKGPIQRYRDGADTTDLPTW